MTLGTQGALSLTVTETDLTNLTATIKRPSGAEEPCGLRRQPSGQLGLLMSLFCFEVLIQ